jgi:hypothetical protein
LPDPKFLSLQLHRLKSLYSIWQASCHFALLNIHMVYAQKLDSLIVEQCPRISLEAVQGAARSVHYSIIKYVSRLQPLGKKNVASRFVQIMKWLPGVFRFKWLFPSATHHQSRFTYCHQTCCLLYHNFHHLSILASTFPPFSAIILFLFNTGAFKCELRMASDECKPLALTQSSSTMFFHPFGLHDASYRSMSWQANVRFWCPQHKYVTVSLCPMFIKQYEYDTHICLFSFLWPILVHANRWMYFHICTKVTWFLDWLCMIWNIKVTPVYVLFGL